MWINTHLQLGHLSVALAEQVVVVRVVDGQVALVVVEHGDLEERLLACKGQPWHVGSGKVR